MSSLKIDKVGNIGSTPLDAELERVASMKPCKSCEKPCNPNQDGHCERCEKRYEDAYQYLQALRG